MLKASVSPVILSMFIIGSAYAAETSGISTGGGGTSYQCQTDRNPNTGERGKVCSCYGDTDCLDMIRDEICPDEWDHDKECSRSGSDHELSCSCSMPVSKIAEGNQSQSEADAALVATPPDDNVLHAPAKPSVSLADHNRSVTVGWTAESKIDYRFAIERMHEVNIFGKNARIWREIGRTGARNSPQSSFGLSHAYNDKSVKPGTKYCYRVSSVKNTVSSGPSDEVCIEVPGSRQK